MVSEKFKHNFTNPAEQCIIVDFSINLRRKHKLQVFQNKGEKVKRYTGYVEIKFHALLTLALDRSN
jgi:hypothetical protein